jgi:hypothetical protein
MNSLLGPSSTEIQLQYLGTHLKGEAHEWFYRHIEHCDWTVRDWTLEAAIQGLQRRFLHTLTHHNASNRFDSVIQSQQTVHELLNDLKKHGGRMIMQPDAYTFRKRFIAALREPLQMKSLNGASMLSSALLSSCTKLLVCWRKRRNTIMVCVVLRTCRAHPPNLISQ